MIAEHCRRQGTTNNLELEQARTVGVVSGGRVGAVARLGGRAGWEHRQRRRQRRRDQRQAAGDRSGRRWGTLPHWKMESALLGTKSCKGTFGGAW